MLAPDSVSVPVPPFEKLPVPEITPANVVEALPAVVRVFVVDEPSEMLAAESLVVAVAIDATVSLLF